MTVRIEEEDFRVIEPPVPSYPVTVYEEPIPEVDLEAVQWEEYHEEIESRDIRGIITDIEAPSSLLLVETRDPDAMMRGIQEHVQWIHQKIKVNMIQLGYYLYWVEKLEYYRYAGDDMDMRAWMESIDLNPDIRTHAIALYKLWTEMRDLGYPIQKLIEGTITPVKIQAIQFWVRDYRRQEKALPPQQEQDEEEELEEQPALYIVSDQQEEPSLPEKITPALVNLRAKIDTIIASRDKDIVAENKERQGIPERVPLALYNLKVSSSGLVTATVTFDGNEEKLRAIFRGYTTFLFQFPKVDGYLSSENVKEGHPDKIIDQLAGIVEAKVSKRLSYDELDDLD